MPGPSPGPGAGAGPLRETSEVHRALLEQVGDHVLLVRPDPEVGAVIVDINDVALRALGYQREELLGQPLSVLDPVGLTAGSRPRAEPSRLGDPDFSSEMLREALSTLHRGQPVALDARHRRKDGSFLDVAIRSVALQVGGEQLVLSAERDITHRKRTEAQLAYSHRLMSYIISHARSAIAVHDRELRYIYVSERYLKEYNVKEQDVIGQHHYEVFPDLPQKWRDVHQRALAGEVSSAEEDPYERADGSLEWTRWECRPWYEMDGTIGGIIVYTEVITERKRAEEERRALENQLQQAMKMEAVGRLAGGIAHDFNNLLTAITANVGLAQLDLPAAHPAADRLRDVSDAADRAAALTRQLLTFSRRQMIEPKVLDLNELVANLKKLLTRLIGEDIVLRFALSPALPAIRVDPGQLEQVLVNLAVNARDAMPDGGQIVIETAVVELDETYCASHARARPGEFVRLAVSDTGHGLTDEAKQHLFEPFFTAKARDRGTGLGLSTTCGIVRQAGGSLEVYSEPGCGTSFKIYLPAVAGEVSRLARPDDELPTGHETILLVEDDDAVRAAASRCLQRLGYTVLEAERGPEALAALARHAGPLDLLLTDVIMPGINGRELAERVKRVRPAARVLYASGYTENVIAHHGVLEAGLDFISKPYSPGRLAHKVREVLDAGPHAGTIPAPDDAR